MPLRIVQSKQNSRLKELRRAFAQPGRGAQGLAAIEGPNLLAEALRAGLALRTVFVAESAQHLLDGLALSPQVEVLILSSDLLLSALATEAPQPIAALVQPPRWTWHDILQPAASTAPLILVLAGLQDPGNIGTILRSAEAFAATGIVALPGTVSPWNPKAVRASAGSVFRLPLLHAEPADCLARLHAAGLQTFATIPHGAAPAPEADLAAPVALLIGNEGNGLAPELARQASAAITIPCPGPVESLNAAVATSILLYEASRQRGGKP